MIRDPAYAEATAGQVGDRRDLGLVKANSALWRLGRSNELLDRSSHRVKPRSHKIGALRRSSWKAGGHSATKAAETEPQDRELAIRQTMSGLSCVVILLTLSRQLAGWILLTVSREFSERETQGRIGETC